MNDILRLSKKITAITRQQGYPPSVRQLADALGWTLNLTQRRLDEGVEAGRFRRTPGVARSITVVDK